MADSTKRESVLKITLDSKEALRAITEYQAEIQKTRNVVASYKDAQRDLDKAFREGKVDTVQYKAETEKLNLAIERETLTQKELTRQMRQVEHQTSKQIQMQSEQTGSLRSLRGQLSTLTAQYDNLSASERQNEAVGGKLRQQIAEIYNQISIAEQETGRFQRNVGNYSMQVVDGFSAMGGGASKVSTSVNKLKGNVLALQTASGWIGLMVNVVLYLVNALKQNESAMEGVRTALAPLAYLGVQFNKVLERMTDWLGRVTKRVGEYAKQLGLVSDAMKEEQGLTEMEIAQEKYKRDVIVNTAKREKEIAELRLKAVQKDKYSAQERIAFMEQAIKQEKTIAEDRRMIAKNELALAKARASQGANSAEELQRLAELEADAIRADTEYLNKTRELESKLVEFRKELGASAKSDKDETKQAEVEKTEAVAEEVGNRVELYAKEIEMRLSLALKGSEEEQRLEEERLRLKYEKLEQELEDEGATLEQILLLRAQYDQDLLNLQMKYSDEEDKIAYKVANAQIEASHNAYLSQKADAENLKAVKVATANAIGDSLANLGNVMEAFSDKDKGLAKASKVLALAKIAIETGIATAQGIAQSQSVPFPANIAAIATTLATITGGIASAVSTVKSAKFAKGGYVSGPGTATSDSVPARLSNGESVINARATSMYAPLLSAINQMGGGNSIETPAGADTSALESAIARGMRSAKLSVSVTEIDSVRERIDDINTKANV